LLLFLREHMILKNISKKNINKAFQTKNIKGMISFKDGRINPYSLLQTLD